MSVHLAVIPENNTGMPAITTAALRHRCVNF
jgi:hypothetical protein